MTTNVLKVYIYSNIRTRERDTRRDRRTFEYGEGPITAFIVPRDYKNLRCVVGT